MEPVWTWITFIVLLIGLAGTVLPLLPGLPLMALAVLVYGWAEGFRQIGLWFVIITAVLAFLGTIADYLAGPYAAKRLGASPGGVWGAVAGGIVGILTLGFLGLIVGPFIGSFLGELLYGKRPQQAARVGVGSVAGVAAANIVKFFLALIICVVFFMKVII